MIYQLSPGHYSKNKEAIVVLMVTVMGEQIRETKKVWESLPCSSLVSMVRQKICSKCHKIAFSCLATEQDKTRWYSLFIFIFQENVSENVLSSLVD